ncbi:MAG: hypothetical protein AAF439_01455 [Pseudomonadota bacterium]
MTFSAHDGGVPCRYCGDASSAEVCPKPGCQTQATRDKAAEAQRRLLDGLRAKGVTLAGISSQTLLEEAEKLGRPIDKVPIAILPRVEKPLVPFPQDELQALIDNLDTAIEEAFETPVGGVAFDRDSIDNPEPSLGDACCATCRGSCCRVGRNTHAFIDATTIRHVRVQMPEATRDEIRDLYLTRLPEAAVEGSCAFHGPMGCTLQRNTRADICNRHRCLPLQLFLKSADENDIDAGLLIGAGNDTTPVVATRKTDGSRTERPIGEREYPSEAVVAAVAAQVPDKV